MCAAFSVGLLFSFEPDLCLVGMVLILTLLNEEEREMFLDCYCISIIDITVVPKQWQEYA